MLPSNRISLSVVIPAYNEEERIAKTITTITKYFKGQDASIEILIIDDGSTDKTASIVLKLQHYDSSISLIRLPENVGKGKAVQTGILKSNNEYILISDADLSTPIEETEKLLLPFKDGYDIVIGSRKLPKSQIYIAQPFYRKIVGTLYQLMVRAIIGIKFRDTQCGFKCFRREVAWHLFSMQRVNRFGFDVEILYLAHRCRYLVKEIPVRWSNAPKSKVHLLKDSINMFVDLLKVRLRHRCPTNPIGSPPDTAD